MQQFNPYHEWLGLDANLTDPNHYQLLGLSPAESSAEAISQAADMAMSRVRQFRPGDKARDWAQLLDRLRECKRCLTDPVQRAAYDVQIGPSMAAPASPEEGAPAVKPASSIPAATSIPTAEPASPVAAYPPNVFTPPTVKSEAAGRPEGRGDAPQPQPASSPAKSPSFPGGGPGGRSYSSPAAGPATTDLFPPSSAPSNPAQSVSSQPSAQTPVAPAAPASLAAAGPPMATWVTASPANSPAPSAAPQSLAPQSPLVSPVLAGTLTPTGSCAPAGSSYAPAGSPAPVAAPVASAWPTGQAANAPAAHGGGIPMGTTYVPAGASSQPASYNPTAGLDPMAPYDPYQAPYQAASPVAPYQAASPVAPAFGHSPVPASQPQGMSGIPLGAAVASAWPASNAPLSPGFGSPASGAPASGSAVGVAKPSAAKTARGRANQGRHVPLVFTIAVLMIAVTGGVLFVTLGNPNRDGANAERQVVQASPTGASSRYSTRNASRPTAPPPAERTSPNSVSIAAEPDENDTAWGPASDGEGMQPPRMSRTEAPMPVEAMSRPDIETPIETMPAPVMTEATTPSPDATPAPQPTAMETEPATSPEPAVPTVPEPDSPPTPTPTPEPAMIAMSSPEQVQALAQSLTTARLALGEMNFDLADAELAKAKPLATLPAHQAKLERLEQLAHYVKEFRAALVEAIKGFESGQGIQITQSTSIGIVEPNPNLLVIRVAGVNRRYTLNELPLGLAVALADEWLDQVAASSKLAKGAYVIVHKKASVDNIAKARGWWEEAGASDPDLVRDLMPVIDDRYDDLAADLK